MQTCQVQGSVTRPAAGLDERAFQRAHAYIVQRLGENPSLAEIAAVACISRFHFARLFRARTGLSPMAYAMRLRLERAKELLTDGTQCIADTAAALGFSDQSHFCRAFRRAHGMPPRDFRMRLRDASLHARPRAVHVHR